MARSITQTQATIVITESALARNQKKATLKKLQATLEGLRKSDNVTGFILKNSTQAIADLKDTENMSNYALLTEQLFDASEKLAHFDTGTTESIMFENKKIRMLCLRVGETQLSIFMEKNADHTKILKHLSFQAEQTL